MGRQYDGKLVSIYSFIQDFFWADVQMHISDSNWTRIHNHLVRKRTLKLLTKLALNDWALLWVLICMVHLTVCSYHVTHSFQSESTLNGWVFVYELSGCGFESSRCHLNFRFYACFEQGVPWHSGNHRVWVHSETRTWHDQNIQYRSVFRTQSNAFDGTF